MIQIDILNKLCAEGMPIEGCYDLCAVYLLEYEKSILDDNLRRNNLKKLLEIDSKNKNKAEANKKSNSNLNEIFPKNKINLQTNEILKIDREVTLDNNKLFKRQLLDVINNKIVFNTIQQKEKEEASSSHNSLQDYFKAADDELLSKLIQTNLNKVNFSLELRSKDQDIVNHDISK